MTQQAPAVLGDTDVLSTANLLSFVPKSTRWSSSHTAAKHLSNWDSSSLGPSCSCYIWLADNKGRWVRRMIKASTRTSFEKALYKYYADEAFEVCKDHIHQSGCLTLTAYG